MKRHLKLDSELTIMSFTKPFVICSAAALVVLSVSGSSNKANAGAYSAALKSFESDNSYVLKQVRKRRRRRKRRAATHGSPPAAALKTISKNAPANSSLFGTKEFQSDNFKPFKKWRGAMKRMASEQSDLDAFKNRFKKWVAFLDSIKDKPKIKQIKWVNSFMNKSRYIQDNKNWGKKDYWAAPGEFFTKFGDCEDYSIAKYMGLKYLGFDTKRLRIVAVKDMNLKVGHAILAVYHDNRIIILDNQIRVMVDSRQISHYNPVYSINEYAWWRHQAG